MNPNKHKREWNAMRLIMKVSEINYCIFIDYDKELMQLHPVTKDEFKDFNYNEN